MEKEQEAANETVEQPTEVESAPTEEKTSGEVQQESSEKTETSEPSVDEKKMVPLTALQEERTRRKEAEQYVRQITEQPDVPPVLPDESIPPYPEARQQIQYQEPEVMTRDEYDFREREKQNWQEAEKDFPDVKGNPKLKEYAEAYRSRKMIKDGVYLSVKDAVKETVGLFKEAKADGQKSAQESVEIQKRGALESGGSKVDAKTNEANELVEIIKTSDDPKEKQAALRQLLKKEQ